MTPEASHFKVDDVPIFRSGAIVLPLRRCFRARRRRRGAAAASAGADLDGGDHGFRLQRSPSGNQTWQ